MTPITFPVPAIKFGKSDAELILQLIGFAMERIGRGEFSDEDEADIDAIAGALEEFLA